MSREILTFATENLKRNEMKKILLMICALVLMMSAQAKTKVIDRPAYLSNTALYELKPMKVELTMKATIVHFHVVNAKWGGWNVAEARLVCNGDTLAFKSGRVITHDGDKVLAEEPFELGKNIDKNIQRHCRRVPRRLTISARTAEGSVKSRVSRSAKDSTPRCYLPISHSLTTANH